MNRHIADYFFLNYLAGTAFSLPLIFLSKGVARVWRANGEWYEKTILRKTTSSVPSEKNLALIAKIAGLLFFGLTQYQLGKRIFGH